MRIKETPIKRQARALPTSATRGVSAGLKEAYAGLQRDPYSTWNIEGWDMALERDPPTKLTPWLRIARSLSRFYKGKSYAGDTYAVADTGFIEVHTHRNHPGLV